MKISASLIFLMICLYVNAQWEPFSPDGIHANKIRFYVDAANNWAVCHEDGIYLYNLNNQSWTNHPGIASNKRDATWLNGDSILVAVGDAGISTDGIYTLNASTGYYGEVLGFKSPNFIEHNFQTGRYFIGGSKGFAYSDDAYLWYIFPEFLQKTILDMAIYQDHLVISQIDTAQHIYISIDDGINWTQISGTPAISDLEFDKSGKLFGVFPGESYSSGLWSSNDFGATWNVEFWAVGLNCVGTDPFGNVFVGFGDTQPFQEGIARWDSLDQQLYYMNTGLSDLHINQITTNPDMSAPALFCCTNSGVFLNNNYVNIEEEIIVPSSLKLWPNPVTNTLNIIHNMDGELMIRITSAGGTMIDGFKHNGASQLIQYDCSAMEAGIYIIQVENALESRSNIWIKE